MTAQCSDILIIDSTRHALIGLPPLPRKLIRTTHRKTDRKDEIGISVYEEVWRDADGVQHREEARSIVYSTGCWRNYIATWELKDDRLYLAGIIGKYRLASPEPMFANWVSQVLYVRKGKIIKYVHMDFFSVSEQELRILIRKGVVKRKDVVDNTAR